MAKKAEPKKTNGKVMKKADEKTSGLKLVIVESPTKARTIRKFLGKEYIVESCMGHVRDLPQSSKDIPTEYKKESWAQLGVNVDDDFDPIYCIPKDKIKVVNTLKAKLKEVDELYLATDEDREGESISWHLSEILKPKVPMKRMVFNEITRNAIQKALKDTRHIDMNLVKAQEARRILDRLVGYSISPLLWKKIAYGLSAGRVQSVAVRLIAEREHQRIRFKKSDYWSLLAELNKDSIDFESRISSYKNSKIATGKDFDGETGKLIDTDKNLLILNEKKAKEILQSFKNQKWQVLEVEEKPVFKKPAPPFITSTLQQEANRKLGMSSRETMQVAQKLYEQGFITYMRTDSSFLSNEAIQAARQCIQSKYGKNYLPEKPRTYEAKIVKGAQEAHEAIRPSGTDFIDPNETGLNNLPLKLYEMIWMRTVASQMLDSKQKQVLAKIKVGEAIFNSSGMSIEFPGFLRAYVEGSDDPEAELLEKEVLLPKLQKGDTLKSQNIKATDHETKAPARYTEASLIQKMEKEGIGRPSTYASIIGTIIDRGYARKQANALIPTFTALVVSKLLKNFLPQFVDLGFTSEMEKSLDTIAEGDLDSHKYLAQIYFGKTGLKSQIEIQEKKIDPDEARSINLEGLEKISFRVGKFGAYLCTKRAGKEVSASLPESVSPAEVTLELAEKLIDQKINGADALGKDPKTGLPVYVLSGRYGPYVQLGDADGEDAKPKRSSIPSGVPPESIQLKQALDLLSLPKTLGIHPSLKKDVKAGIGRFGPFVVCEGDYRSIPKGENIFDTTFKRALELLSIPKKGRSAPLKVIGNHPKEAGEIHVKNGPYGAYLKFGKKNYSLPDGVDPLKLSLEQALQIMDQNAKDQGTVKAEKKKQNVLDKTPINKTKVKIDLQVSDKVIAKKKKKK